MGDRKIENQSRGSGALVPASSAYWTEKFKSAGFLELNDVAAPCQSEQSSAQNSLVTEVPVTFTQDAMDTVKVEI